ncbi:hypothetical protein TCAL_09940 [Tigriopus californicus]|uniref:Carboxypeptidase regulatory-like domain-containing protein n=2 Tax=Tigriopus californicus TaxID=6832 RepID=A0A553PTL9_TIGCA|nr:uncharacterized protein LOC131891633 isoform X2 [Tigriopus californicus]TRY81033.1 hypothetical protein TCAL_09940 [Tigriopus californicus]
MLAVLLVTLVWAVSTAYFGISTINAIDNSTPSTDLISTNIFLTTKPYTAPTTTTTIITTTTTTTTTTSAIAQSLRLQIENALNGDPIPGALVTLQSDVTRQMIQAEIDSNGLFVASVGSIGQEVMVTIEHDGFISLQDYVITSSSAQSDSARVISMSPVFDTDVSKRMVLNWNPYAVNLDTLVLQFAIGRDDEDCVVFYANRMCGNMNLDRDVLHGKDGGETVTWKNEDEFGYAIVIADFSGANEYSLIETEAKMIIYVDDGFVLSLDIPKEEPSPRSRFWVVGCLKGSRGASSFVEVNKIVDDDPANDPDLCFST